MAEKEEAAQVKAGRTIWLLLLGSRGDTQPAVALSAGLQDAGHTVRALGCGHMGLSFHANGIPFSAFDEPLILSPGGHDAAEELTVQAEAAGFKEVEDYVLDSLLLWHEHLMGAKETLLECGVPQAEIDGRIGGDAGDLDKFYRTGSLLEKLPEKRRAGLLAIAKRAKQSPDDYATVGEKRRAAFRSFLKGKASALQRHPVSLLHYWYAAFGLSTKEQQSQREAVAAFCEWQARDDVDMEAWWQHWWAKSNFRTCDMGITMLGANDAARRHLALRVKREKPDLVIYHFALASPAYMLKGMGVSTLIWWPQLPPLDLHGQWLKYLELIGSEVLNPEASKPLVGEGPLHFLDTLQSTRQLITASKVFLRQEDFGGNSDYMRTLHSCCTGSLVLREEALQGTDGFATPEEERALSRFLAVQSERPVVCFCFGSMTGKNLAELIAKTTCHGGFRCIFIAGFSGVDEEALKGAFAKAAGEESLEDRFLWLASASHERLFPQCQCVVHHCGLGTAHAVLRAGIPTVVAPDVFDQFRNAEIVKSLGSGSMTRKLTEVTHFELAHAIKTAVGSEEMKQKAKALAYTLQLELGVKNAVKLVERCLSEPDSWKPASCPWHDGPYEVHRKGTPSINIEIKGAAQLSGPNPLGWMRAGSWNIWGTEYNVQCFSLPLMSIVYFKLSADGGLFTAMDGGTMRHKGKGGGLRWDLLLLLAFLVALAAAMLGGGLPQLR